MGQIAEGKGHFIVYTRFNYTANCIKVRCPPTKLKGKSQARKVRWVLRIKYSSRIYSSHGKKRHQKASLSNRVRWERE